MKKRWIALSAGAACAACCIPLIWPLLGGGVAAAGLFAGATIDQLICIGVPLLIAGGALVFWRTRRQPAPRCGCTGSCTVPSSKVETSND